MDLLNLLLEPLRFDFMLRGLLAAVMVGIVCSVVGTFVVLRGMAFFGDALAHAILPGVALGYLTGGGSSADRSTLFWWALGAAIFSALGIGAITHGGRVKEDSAIGIVFVGMFALGIALISAMRSFAVDLSHFLFGNVLGVSPTDLWHVALGGGLALLTVRIFYRQLVAVAFDETHATTLRLPVTMLNYLLLVLIAVVVVVALQTVGIALVLAMLITPATSASLLVKRLPAMMALAALIGAFSSASGLYLSYYISIASGAAIVLVCVGFFLLVLLVAPERGWLWRVLWRRKPKRAARYNDTVAQINPDSGG
ncbi:MAG: metal ABC transporter permease [Chloroflexaceae bacterium]|nr:metal ABC transporter permease [Chloroflexaceae bacterium]